MTRRDKIYKEAKVFGRYIINKEVSEPAAMRYAEGLDKLGYNTENYIVDKVVKHPYLLPFYDAALAFSHRDHILEKKLLLMFAVLETMPEYSDVFLARKRSGVSAFVIVFTGVTALFKLLVGKLFLSIEKFK